MTFTENEIKEEQLVVDYNDEWQFNDEDKTVDVRFYGFENRLRRFFNLEDDYGDDWIDCYATIDPVKGIVIRIFMVFTSNCDIPDRELSLNITNNVEGKWLLDNMLENDKDIGGFVQFINEAKEEYK